MNINKKELLAFIDKKKTLDLSMRQNLWRLYGDGVIKGKYAEKTKALTSRVRLAMSCMDYVKDLWMNNDTIDLHGLLRAIQTYIEGNISGEELEKIYYKYRSLTENIDTAISTEEYECIAMACCHVALIALYDEPLLVEAGDIESDDELDSLSWDTSYLISLIISEEDKTTYWRWYIDEAIKLILL